MLRGKREKVRKDKERRKEYIRGEKRINKRKEKERR